jgi:hypothetical protein
MNAPIASTLFDDSRDAFGHPGLKPGGERADAELFDQCDEVSGGIVKQDGDGMAPLEHFSGQRRAPAAIEQPMLQSIAIDPEIALKDRLTFADRDIALCHLP